MVVKSKRGRRRYIAVKVRGEEALTDEALLSHLTSVLYRSGIRYKVIQFDGRKGILRVEGVDSAKAVENLNVPEGPIVTVKTSGTLRSLRGERSHRKKH